METPTTQEKLKHDKTPWTCDIVVAASTDKQKWGEGGADARAGGNGRHSWNNKMMATNWISINRHHQVVSLDFWRNTIVLWTCLTCCCSYPPLERRWSSIENNLLVLFFILLFCVGKCYWCRYFHCCCNYWYCCCCFCCCCCRLLVVSLFLTTTAKQDSDKDKDNESTKTSTTNGTTTRLKRYHLDKNMDLHKHVDRTKVNKQDKPKFLKFNSSDGYCCCYWLDDVEILY
jgi:hypothetical protein